ncbi:MAG: amino acid--tRNA ligase-related protein, partial [Anaerolineae bacterium]
MAQIIRIEHIARYEGQAVTLQGWLQLKTGKGKLQFLRVRDGTGVVQAVVFKGNVSEQDFEVARRLPLESSLVITGTVRADARAPGIPGGYELDVTGLEVIQESAEYPIGPKEHGIEFLMDNRHLWLRSNRQWAIMRVRATIVKAMRDWLDDNGFTLVDTPILTPSAAEGTTTLFKVDYHGEDAYLAQTGQLYNEANIFSVGRTYCFGPTFRAEKSKTRRHLQEFWMVEPEIAFCRLEELLEIEEQYVSYIVQTTLRQRAAELKLLERDTTALEKVIPPFPRLSYDEAVEMINAAAARGVTVPPHDEPLPPIQWGDDFGAPHETFFARQFEKPVFVHHF